MDLVSFCPFVASKIVWQAHSGAFALTVIVKATFVLQPETSVLASEQDPVFERDRFNDDDLRRSVRIPSDHVPYKPRADVMLVGHAYAPGKQPVRSLMTRFVVGDMDKSIEVWCDRAFRVVDAQLLEGKRFTQMPLVWERAAGGPESANPVGMRFDAQPDAYGTIAIANLQPPGQFVSKRSDTFVPTCYAPVSSTWPGRTQRLGRLSRSYFDGRWLDKRLPEGLDPTFFLAAPWDQHVAEIRANERIVLEHLHPEHPRLVTSLPGHRPRAIADRATGEREEISLVGDTLWVDTDRGVCCVVWRGRMGLRTRDEAGRIAVRVDGTAMVELGNAPRRTLKVEDDPANVTMTMMGASPANAAPALPFVAGVSRLSELNRAMAADISRWTDATNDDETGTTLVPVSKASAKALPFEHQQADKEGLVKTIPPLLLSGLSMPFVAPIDAAPLFDPPDQYAKERISAPGHIHALEAEPESAHIEVAPPPMIGPLAKGEMEHDKPALAEPAMEEKVSERAPVAEAPPEDIIELSIEETAIIAAELAEGYMEKAKVLDAHKVTEHAWAKNKQRWDAAIADEQGKGKNTLRSTHDAAHVKRVEGFRGPITADDYARIVVAIERRRVSQELDQLKIQRAAQMPIIRIWVIKVALDRALGEQVMSAMAAARRA